MILPAYKGRWNVHWTKAGAILPQRIAGKYWMFYMADGRDRRDQTGVAYSTDLLTWTEALDQPILPRRAGYFDSRVVEPGPPPILTGDGVLLIYNGADDRLVYRTGWALFDRNDPTRPGRPQRPPALRADDGVGKDRTGAERRFCRRTGGGAPPLARLLWWRGQAYWRRVRGSRRKALTWAGSTSVALQDAPARRPP